MKTRTITVVYQDCFLCGSKRRALTQSLAKKGIILRKVGFSTKEGEELIHKAVFTHKIGSMPFYVEGDRFSASLERILEVPKKKRKAKKIEEPKDGTASEV